MDSSESAVNRMAKTVQVPTNIKPIEKIQTLDAFFGETKARIVQGEDEESD